MNFKQVMIVFRKEFLELLRDKRTLFTTLLLPVILYPVMIIGFNAIMTRQTGVLEKQAATVAIADSVNNAISASLIADLKKLENFSFIPTADNTQSMYTVKEIQAIVTIKDSLTALGLNTYHVYVQYDAANERSSTSFQKIKEILAGSEKRLMTDQLKLSGVDPELMKLLDLRQVDTATSQRKMGMLLGMVLPYIMIIMLLSGASVAAADLVAGEKERKTLETLMVSGVGRMEIVIGKYFTILVLGMVNLIVNLFSISVSLKYMLSQSGVEMAGVEMPLKAIFILLAAMLPLATFFSAVLLSISTFSRNMKEARSYEQPLLIVSMMLAMISFLPAIEMSNLLALIPVVNIALLFKAVMIEDYQISHLLITIISTLALDIFAIWGTIRLFKTESILFRS
ncbi:MAG TPA: ABC transporter permease subunit, partial [Candidatus Cloacimonadota bacterium]|nr:ABC transporter permease subunit [Candidatus Cloacimonadota bacterium]